MQGLKFPFGISHAINWKSKRHAFQSHPEGSWVALIPRCPEICITWHSAAKGKWIICSTDFYRLFWNRYDCLARRMPSEERRIWSVVTAVCINQSRKVVFPVHCYALPRPTRSQKLVQGCSRHQGTFRTLSLWAPFISFMWSRMVMAYFVDALLQSISSGHENNEFAERKGSVSSEDVQRLGQTMTLPLLMRRIPVARSFFGVRSYSAVLAHFLGCWFLMTS